MDTTPIADLDAVTGLAGGLIGDAEQLVQQQIALAKAELREELARVKARAWGLGLGIAFLLLGCLQIPGMLSDLLFNLGEGRLPLWGAKLLISLALLGLGMLFLRTPGTPRTEIAEPAPKVRQAA